jgi:hypothetical protein
MGSIGRALKSGLSALARGFGSSVSFNPYAADISLHASPFDAPSAPEKPGLPPSKCYGSEVPYYRNSW